MYNFKNKRKTSKLELRIANARRLTSYSTFQALCEDAIILILLHFDSMIIQEKYVWVNNKLFRSGEKVIFPSKHETINIHIIDTTPSEIEKIILHSKVLSQYVEKICIKDEFEGEQEFVNLLHISRYARITNKCRKIKEITYLNSKVLNNMQSENDEK